MSELADLMARMTFLELCINIEGLCADIYHQYSSIYADNPEISQLWKKTALEEENHQKQFGLAFRLMNETGFEIMTESLKRAYYIHGKLITLREHVRRNPPDLLTAVSKAVEMEEQLSDLHTHTAIKFREESMQQFFYALSAADSNHVAELQRYQAILTLPQTEMKNVACI